MAVSDTQRDEYMTLLTQTTEYPSLSAASQSWCGDNATLRRYIDCAEANGCSAVDNIAFLVRTATWRDTMQLDALMRDEAMLEFERKMRSLLLYDLTSDRNGRPLMIERVGAWDVAALAEAVESSHDDIVRAHVMVSERIRQQVDSRLHEAPTMPERQAMLVMDADGIGWAHVRATTLLNLFATMSSLDNNHFPDTVRSRACRRRPLTPRVSGPLLA